MKTLPERITMNRIITLTAVFSLFVSAACIPTHAGVIVAVQNASLAAGGSGFVDVVISSDATDNLDAFGYDFQILDVGSPVGSLRFERISGATQSNSEVTDSSYVFFGDSDGFDSFPNNGPAFNRVQGGDFTASLLGTNLPATNLLLARLELYHDLPTGVPPASAAGDLFTISLLPGIDTFFWDSAGDDLVLANSFSGTVTIAAVPEPSSLALLGTILGFFAVKRCRRSSFENRVG